MTIDLGIFIFSTIVTTSIAFYRRTDIRKFKTLGYDEKVVIFKLLAGCVFSIFGLMVIILVKIFKRI